MGKKKIKYNNIVSYSLANEIKIQQIKCEENCISKVIEDYTGKPLTIENAPKVTRSFFINDYSRYILGYDGIQLGMIRYINDGYNFKVEFTPNEISFNNETTTTKVR